MNFNFEQILEYNFDFKKLHKNKLKNNNLSENEDDYATTVIECLIHLCEVIPTNKMLTYSMDYLKIDDFKNHYRECEILMNDLKDYIDIIKDPRKFKNCGNLIVLIFNGYSGANKFISCFYEFMNERFIETLVLEFYDLMTTDISKVTTEIFDQFFSLIKKSDIIYKSFYEWDSNILENRFMFKNNNINNNIDGDGDDDDDDDDANEDGYFGRFSILSILEDDNSHIISNYFKFTNYERLEDLWIMICHYQATDIAQALFDLYYDSKEDSISVFASDNNNNNNNNKISISILRILEITSIEFSFPILTVIVENTPNFLNSIPTKTSMLGMKFKLHINYINKNNNDNGNGKVENIYRPYGEKYDNNNFSRETEIPFKVFDTKFLIVTMECSEYIRFFTSSKIIFNTEVNQTCYDDLNQIQKRLGFLIYSNSNRFTFPFNSWKVNNNNYNNNKNNKNKNNNNNNNNNDDELEKLVEYRKGSLMSLVFGFVGYRFFSQDIIDNLAGTNIGNPNYVLDISELMTDFEIIRSILLSENFIKLFKSRKFTIPTLTKSTLIPMLIFAFLSNVSFDMNGNIANLYLNYLLLNRELYKSSITISQFGCIVNYFKCQNTILKQYSGCVRLLEDLYNHRKEKSPNEPYRIDLLFGVINDRLKAPIFINKDKYESLYFVYQEDYQNPSDPFCVLPTRSVDLSKISEEISRMKNDDFLNELEKEEKQKKIKTKQQKKKIKKLENEKQKQKVIQQDKQQEKEKKQNYQQPQDLQQHNLKKQTQQPQQPQQPQLQLQPQQQQAQQQQAQQQQAQQQQQKQQQQQQQQSPQQPQQQSPQQQSQKQSQKQSQQQQSPQQQQSQQSQQPQQSQKPQQSQQPQSQQQSPQPQQQSQQSQQQQSPQPQQQSPQTQQQTQQKQKQQKQQQQQKQEKQQQKQEKPQQENQIKNLKIEIKKEEEENNKEIKNKKEIEEENNKEIKNKKEKEEENNKEIKSKSEFIIVEDEDFVSIGKFKFNRNESNILGRGSNGTLVFKGMWSDKIPVAIKQMQKAFNPLINKEVEALITLTNKNCSNMIRYIDKEEDKNFVYLGLTLCDVSLQYLVENGKLNEFINLSGKSLNELAKDIINGIQFLHSHDIVHNDLNPRNILTLSTNKNHNNKSNNKNKSNNNNNSNNNSNNSFIISDLGLSKMEVESSYSFTTNVPTGQGGYHPIEVLQSKRMTKSVDIFSLGCILFYLFTNGQHPFGNDKLFRIYNIMLNKVNLELLGHNLLACDLIKSMISNDESKRPTIENVLNHPLFWNVEKKIQFIDAALNISKESNTSGANKFNKSLNYLFVISLSSDYIEPKSEPFLKQTWDKLIDINNLSIGSTSQYQYDQIKDLIRFIRNIIVHHKDIKRLIQQQQQQQQQKQPTIEQKFINNILTNQDSILFYFESKIPNLIYHLYKQLKEYSSSFDYLIKFYN
ncbi:hypothetical protein ACTFIW_011835 [Dictyostelium discoideum]